jgi:hypothetical protein
VLILAPVQVHSTELNPSEPRWRVLNDGKPLEIGALPPFAQFRIEYRALEPSALPAEAQNV